MRKKKTAGIYEKFWVEDKKSLMWGDDDEWARANPSSWNMETAENKNKNKNHLNDDRSLHSFLQLQDITCPNISFSLYKFAEIIK